MFCNLFFDLSLFLLWTSKPSISDILSTLFALCFQSGTSLFFFFRKRLLPFLPCFSVTGVWCQCCSDVSPRSLFNLIQWLTNSHADPAAAYTYVTLNSGNYKENRITLPVTERACLVLIKCRIRRVTALNNVRKINISEVTRWMALRPIQNWFELKLNFLNNHPEFILPDPKVSFRCNKQIQWPLKGTDAELVTEKEEGSKICHYLFGSQRVNMDFYVNLSEIFLGEGLKRKHDSSLSPYYSHLWAQRNQTNHADYPD